MIASPPPRSHLTLFTRAILHRAQYQQDLFRRIEGVPGALVECGVGQGGGLAVWLSFLLRENRGRRLWAFDSFEGFPPLSDADNPSPEFRAGLSEYAQFNIPYVRKTLIDFGHSAVDIDSQIVMVKGFIPDSLESYDGGSVALLYVDLDIYEGYRDSLAYFWDKLSPGGIVAFDEYMKPLDTHKWPGAAKAVNEFLDARGLRSALQFDPMTGNAFIIKPKDVPA